MCLFVRNNKISVQRDEQIPVRLTTPRKPDNFCVIAPALFALVEKNSMDVKTTITSVDHAEKGQTSTTELESSVNTRVGELNTVGWTKVNGDSELLVEVFGQESPHSGSVGTVLGELDEEQQIKIVEQNIAIKNFQNIKFKLDQAKKNFHDVSALLKEL